MIPTKYTIAESIHNYLNKNKAFVFYRKNKSDRVIALIQNDDKLHTTKNFDETGFVMAPFNCANEAVLLPCSETKKEFFEIPAPKKQKKITDYTTNESDKKNYKLLIKKTVEFIKAGNADKVVISRKIEKAFDNGKAGLLFETLLQEYPDTMVYLWYHPKVGLWIGASPEKMLYVKKDNFSTMSLAGTQLKSDEIKWHKKEQQEQQLVTDFITDQLIPIAHSIEISEPYTKFAGHLAHIRTDITGILEENVSLKDLIFKVHPTPAVCGTPRNTSREYLLRNENYDRVFYTGFFGELNLHDNTDLYVNLRCMQIDDKIAKIYVGGGITKDSIPENEWEETYYKSLILTRFL